jgi:hypothetical protein
MQPLRWFSNLPREELYYLAAAAAILLGVAGIVAWQGHNQSQPVTSSGHPLVRTAVIGSANATQGLPYSGEVRGLA